MSLAVPIDTVLETPRCRLRAPSQDDLEFVFSATRVEGFNDGMLWEPPETIDELRVPLKRNLSNWLQGASYTFTLTDRATERFLGRISIRKTEDADIWDIGFWTHPTAHGEGYMTEAARAVLDFGFERLNAKEIGACHATWNGASRRVLEKIGMMFVKHVPEGFQKKGKWVAEDCLHISREQWMSERATL